MKNLSLIELEIVFKLLVLKLKNENINNISFDKDKYWIILTDEWNVFSKIPEEAVGSLFDDIDCLKDAIQKNEIISYTDFDRIASVLRAISEIQAPTS
jgi:hypothetical protein